MDDKKLRYQSAFMRKVHAELDSFIHQKNLRSWKKFGHDSLVVRDYLTMQKIENKYERVFNAQIWMERPLKGYTRCKFELACNLEQDNKEKIKREREAVADVLRKFFITELGLVSEVTTATGSTILAVRIETPRIIDKEDDIEENIEVVRFDSEIKKIKEFYGYLNESLAKWNP